MTKEEAIKVINGLRIPYIDEYSYNRNEAIDVAIEALQEPKTIIGIDIPYGSDKGIATIFKGNEKMVLEEVKEIMAVVRCKDCRFKGFGNCPLFEDYICGCFDEDGYCSYGERSEE